MNFKLNGNSGPGRPALHSARAGGAGGPPRRAGRQEGGGSRCGGTTPPMTRRCLPAGVRTWWGSRWWWWGGGGQGSNRGSPGFRPGPAAFPGPRPAGTTHRHHLPARFAPRRRDSRGGGGLRPAQPPAGAAPAASCLDSTAAPGAARAACSAASGRIDESFAVLSVQASITASVSTIYRNQQRARRPAATHACRRCRPQ